MTGTITRKEFVRLGAAALGAGLTPAGATVAKPASPDEKSSLGSLDPVIRLYPAKAVERSGAVRFGPAEIEVMLPFFGPGEVTWNVSVPAAGRYRVAACYSCARPAAQLELHADDSVVTHAAQLTRGYLVADPKGPAADPGGPDSDTFWTEREFYNFERVPWAGELSLTRGVNAIILKVSGPQGGEILRLRSLELTPVCHLNELNADNSAAQRQRANTDWFAAAAYGVWFHFLDLTTPRHGPRKPYPEAVDALDVERLASMVADCGAAYVILTVNHGNPTCPAPIRAWEELHPGWTTRRDLIGELADALKRKHIRLMLYMNCPGLGNLVQLTHGAIDKGTVSESRYARRLIDVFTEFGERYRERVAGYWLDSWFQTEETYPNLPYPALSRAIKAGFPDRMVAFNHWVFPVESAWQDYWSGELTDLPIQRFGSRYLQHGAGRGLQAHSAIRLDAPWFHITPDTEMEPPRYTAAELAAYVRTCREDQAPVTIGIGMFQDGNIGEASLAVMQGLRQLIRG